MAKAMIKSPGTILAKAKAMIKAPAPAMAKAPATKPGRIVNEMKTISTINESTLSVNPPFDINLLLDMMAANKEPVIPEKIPANADINHEDRTKVIAQRRCSPASTLQN
jgi:hypothetical protein